MGCGKAADRTILPRVAADGSPAGGTPAGGSSAGASPAGGASPGGSQAGAGSAVPQAGQETGPERWAAGKFILADIAIAHYRT